MKVVVITMIFFPLDILQMEIAKQQVAKSRYRAGEDQIAEYRTDNQLGNST